MIVGQSTNFYTYTKEISWTFAVSKSNLFYLLGFPSWSKF